MKKKIHVYDIEWDLEDSVADYTENLPELPTEVDYVVDDETDDIDLSDDYEVSEYISDKLSDDYGFCNFGFDYDVIDDETEEENE